MKTIVIISEDYILYKLFEPVLKNKMADSTILHFSSFEEVKTQIDKSKCDLIVADGVMSGVASFEIINYLRLEQRIIVPIFFISEVNIEYFQTKAFESGVSVYYNKPINPFEVSDAIVNALNKN
jgi:DNA-binding response OmpR family regulator